MKFYRTLFK